MKEYLNALQKIMDSGVDRGDRTGTGTRSVFAQQLRFDLADGFPAVTTKTLAWKGVVSELLWFLEGSTDERRLAEIRYGKDRSELEDKTTIWTANANADYWKDNAHYDGDLGRVYGVQWRRMAGIDNLDYDLDGKTTTITEFDQLADIIQNIKDDPDSRRHIVTAWNPAELHKMALPPCHMIFQFYVADGKLSCHMNQRSCDLFLGVPFNIASYALLTHMIAQVCGLGVGELVLTLGDAHIYSNHMDQVKEQLTRTPTELPTLWIDPSIKNINDFTMDSFRLDNYNPQPSIKAAMAV